MSGKPAAPAAAFFWFACGFAALSTLPLIFSYETNLYTAAERFYACPVLTAEPGVARIRYDVIGKGYFGAPRNNNRTHKGIDLYSPLGQPVFASKSGRVAFAGVDKGYGNYVELSHPDGLLTRYAHLSTMTVQTGDWLSKGQILGAIGKTGNADDPQVVPHLHFEIRYKTHAINPSDQLLDPALTLKKQV